MRVGVFDSGLGGLVIAKAIRNVLPHHDIVYLGDTLHLPYGSRSKEAVLRYTQQSIDFLFRQDCQLIIMACNTASALTLRNIQQNYLIENYPDRRVLGVVVPTLETCLEKGYKRIGLIATQRIIDSEIYQSELQKLDPTIQFYQQAAPLLVPALEYESQKWLRPLIADYLKPLLQQQIDSLILGCTHYALLKDIFRQELDSGIAIMSQDELIPAKLADYLRRHPEIDHCLSRNGLTELLVTDITPSYIANATNLFKKELQINYVDIAAP